MKLDHSVNVWKLQLGLFKLILNHVHNFTLYIKHINSLVTEITIPSTLGIPLAKSARTCNYANTTAA